mmetsp:Transcript_2196/g.5092  ORF Transcript_2196/g.5092 Transcript_2196/m.5092 type:complete len:194 (+) Transcript_2196:182-763(+)
MFHGTLNLSISAVLMWRKKPRRSTKNLSGSPFANKPREDLRRLSALGLLTVTWPNTLVSEKKTERYLLEKTMFNSILKVTIDSEQLTGTPLRRVQPQPDNEIRKLMEPKEKQKETEREKDKHRPDINSMQLAFFNAAIGAEARAGHNSTSPFMEAIQSSRKSNATVVSGIIERITGAVETSTGPAAISSPFPD